MSAFLCGLSHFHLLPDFFQRLPRTAVLAFPVKKLIYSSANSPATNQSFLFLYKKSVTCTGLLLLSVASIDHFHEIKPLPDYNHLDLRHEFISIFHGRSHYKRTKTEVFDKSTVFSQFGPQVSFQYEQVESSGGNASYPLVRPDSPSRERKYFLMNSVSAHQEHNNSKTHFIINSEICRTMAPCTGTTFWRTAYVELKVISFKLEN